MAGMCSADQSELMALIRFPLGWGQSGHFQLLGIDRTGFDTLVSRAATLIFTLTYTIHGSVHYKQHFAHFCEVCVSVCMF